MDAQTAQQFNNYQLTQILITFFSGLGTVALLIIIYLIKRAFAAFDKHSEKIEENKEQINNHSVKINDHAQILEWHAEKLSNHENRINDFSSKLK